MLRILLLSISLGLLALLSAGCWDRKEVNDMALVTGAAIDKINNRTIELSVQIYIPHGTGSGLGTEAKEGGTAATTFVRSALGENIADALSKLQEKIPRKIFWGDAEVFIFGESKAKSGIKDDIDYLIRAPQPRERAYVYVNEGSARQILELHTVLERNTSEVLREMSNNRLAMTVTLTDLSYMLTSESNAAALPWVKLLPPLAGQKPNNTSGYIDGTAIFSKGKMVGTIDSRLTKGMLFLRNEIKSDIITVHPESSRGTVSLQLLRSSTRLEPYMEKGKLRMNVRIDTENAALQNTTGLNLIADEKAVNEIEEWMNKDIENRIRQSLKQVQTNMKADTFDFAGSFHRAFPKEWKAIKDNWDELFPAVKVTVQANAKMLRPGMGNITSKNADKENKP